MKKSDMLKINLRIFELQDSISLQISPEKEEVYRKAADALNTAIREYRSKYQLTSLEKLISMAALNFSISNLTTASNKDVEPLLKELQKMDSELETYLNEASSK